MQRTLWRLFLIVFIGVAAGLTVNAVRWDKGKDGVSRRLPYITPPKPPSVATNDIALSEAKALWDTGTAFFLDARASTDYVAGHIANAFNLPVEEFDSAYVNIAPMLAPDSIIICYCDGVECELSHQLVDR